MLPGMLPEVQIRCKFAFVHIILTFFQKEKVLFHLFYSRSLRSSRTALKIILQQVQSRFYAHPYPLVAHEFLRCHSNQSDAHDAHQPADGSLD